MTEVAGLLKVSIKTVGVWVKRGCPYVQKADRSRQQEWQFDIASVTEWRQEQAIQAAVGDTSKLDIDEARRRKLAAEAALAELALRVQRGELIEIETIAKAAGEEFANMRAKLLAMPSKLAPLIIGAKTMPEAQDILETAVVEALDEFTLDARTDFNDTVADAEKSIAPRNGGKPKATAKADSKPVGGQVPTAKPRGKRRTRKVEHVEG